MTTSKPKNDTNKPFWEKFKEQLQGWPPARKKKFAFFVLGFMLLLAFTQFAAGIKNTYYLFNKEQHFLAADSVAANSAAADILKMLATADSSERAQRLHLDSLLEEGFIQTILSNDNR
ncbi:MAG: hypothetical protein LBK47_07855 [Prevotellaceae bacterium]|jgi:hypothetical protein|nr:hypothetical protein [Prevotellaceae bacterium]